MPAVSRVTSARGTPRVDDHPREVDGRHRHRLLGHLEVDSAARDELVEQVELGLGDLPSSSTIRPSSIRSDGSGSNGLENATRPSAGSSGTRLSLADRPVSEELGRASGRAVVDGRRTDSSGRSGVLLVARGFCDEPALARARHPSPPRQTAVQPDPGPPSAAVPSGEEHIPVDPARSSRVHARRFTLVETTTGVMCPDSARRSAMGTESFVAYEAHPDTDCDSGSSLTRSPAWAGGWRSKEAMTSLSSRRRANVARPRSRPARATEALRRLTALGGDVEVLAYAGAMGEEEARSAQLAPTVLGSTGAVTTAQDTRSAAAAMAERGVDLLAVRRRRRHRGRCSAGDWRPNSRARHPGGSEDALGCFCRQPAQRRRAGGEPRPERSARACGPPR